jgi:uncharacterized membrane protein YqjE
MYGTSFIFEGRTLLQIVSWLDSALRDWGIERMPLDSDEAEGETSMWLILAMATAALGIVALGVAGLLFGWGSWAVVASIALTAVLVPSAIFESARNRRRAAAFAAASREIESGRQELEDRRKQLASEAAAIEKRADNVERQYQILTGLVNEKKSKRATSETVVQEPGLIEMQQELDAALKELRKRQEAERLLTMKVTELQSARNRAEQELSRLMAESHKRLTVERESARTVKARKLERAAEEVAERRSVAEKQAGELLAEARAQAQALLAEAEEEAERLSEQGREEFESALRELRLREEEEAEQAGVILADARAKAEQIVREAEETAESLVAQGEAEFESILGQISEYEARERELYEKLRQLDSNEFPVQRSDEAAASVARELEATASESDVEEVGDRREWDSPLVGRSEAEKAMEYLSAAEAAARGSRSAATEQKPPRPAAGASPAIPDLVLLLDSDDDSPGALRRLFGSLRRLGHQDREELPEG